MIRDTGVTKMSKDDERKRRCDTNRTPNLEFILGISFAKQKDTTRFQLLLFTIRTDKSEHLRFVAPGNAN